MSDASLVPQPFGPLQGVRIVSSGTLIAQPFAAELAAEMGAEVIQVERPGTGDVGWRTIGIRLSSHEQAAVSTSWVQERRNIFCISADLSQARARELFLRLLARADIWMESSKPGTYAAWKLDDATVWQINPKLVITHVSGYGQTGHPAYIHRASYDIVGQAFGGMMYQTGFPDPAPPTRAAPWTADYITALFALWSTLAGLTYARSTGQGQAIDVAQFEAVHKTLGGTMVEYFQRGLVRERSGNRAQGFQPLDSFAAKDGWLVLGALSAVYDRLLSVIGLDPSDPKWQRARTDLESVEGIEFDAILRGFINERTLDEVVALMNEHQIPCSRVLSSADMAADAHYQARGVHQRWEDLQVGPVTGVGIAPHFSRTPGQIWRGSVPVGHDNELIYGRTLGVSEAELAELRRQGAI
ncbi:MAG TPA: CoA transferase [Candidatus Binataceae bacterium]|nr:CoA transferase [Candidatus Binataceae bacterium]